MVSLDLSPDTLNDIRLNLTIHITFSIGLPISLSFFIFIYAKYISLKRRLSFLSYHGTHKNKNKRFSRNTLSNFFMAVEV